jgi:hypothetical protein
MVSKEQLLEKLKKLLDVQNIYEASNDEDLYRMRNILGEKEAVCKLGGASGRVVICATKKGVLIEDIDNLLENED